MHPSSAIWMVNGLRPELRSIERDREHRHALEASRRANHLSIAARLRNLRPAQAAEADLAGCAA